MVNNLGVGIPADQPELLDDTYTYVRYGVSEDLVFPLLCDLCDKPAVYDSEDRCCDECSEYFGIDITLIEARCWDHLPFTLAGDPVSYSRG